MIPTQPLVNTNAQQPATTNINLPDKEFNIEYQKFIVDPNPMQIIFYCKFAGWELTTEETEKTLIGVQFKDQRRFFKINYKSRLMNDSGANYLFNSVYPLISQHVTTSFLDNDDIYFSWRGLLKGVNFHLCDSYFIPTCQICNHKRHLNKNCIVCGCQTYIEQRNPYEIHIENIADIMSNLASYYTITKKAKGGQFLKETSETFFTSNINRFGIMPEQQPKNILDKLNPFKK